MELSKIVSASFTTPEALRLRFFGGAGVVRSLVTQRRAFRRFFPGPRLFKLEVGNSGVDVNIRPNLPPSRPVTAAAAWNHSPNVPCMSTRAVTSTGVHNSSVVCVCVWDPLILRLEEDYPRYCK